MSVSWNVVNPYSCSYSLCHHGTPCCLSRHVPQAKAMSWVVRQRPFEGAIINNTPFWKILWLLLLLSTTTTTTTTWWPSGAYPHFQTLDPAPQNSLGRNPLALQPASLWIHADGTGRHMDMGENYTTTVLFIYSTLCRYSYRPMFMPCFWTKITHWHPHCIKLLWCPGPPYRQPCAPCRSQVVKVCRWSFGIWTHMLSNYGLILMLVTIC